MKRYARAQAGELLDRLEKQVRLASDSRDPDAVHDLRVSIRRLRGCLRAFSQFLPGKVRKKARRKAGDLMKLAGAVRDRDIALELYAQAGVPERSPVMERLRADRELAGGNLEREAKRWLDRDLPAKWKDGLGV
jgi:CHAD domain-containing protein